MVSDAFDDHGGRCRPPARRLCSRRGAYGSRCPGGCRAVANDDHHSRDVDHDHHLDRHLNHYNDHSAADHDDRGANDHNHHDHPAAADHHNPGPDDHDHNNHPAAEDHPHGVHG